MGNPDYPSNGQAERVDALVGIDDTARLKLGLGDVAVPGASTDAAWHAAGTHLSGDVLGTTYGGDDAVSLGAVSSGGSVVPLAGDAAGGAHSAVLAPAPSGLHLAQASGTLSAGTYGYRVTAKTAAGESLASVEATLGISASHGVALTWSPVPGAVRYGVYGRTAGSEQWLADTAGPVTSYTDDGSGSPSGALPSASTAFTGLAAGWDGSEPRAIAVDAAGRAAVSAAGAWAGSAYAVPVAVDANGNVMTTRLAPSGGLAYTLAKSGMAATAAGQLLVVEGPSGESAFVTRVTIWNPGIQTTPGITEFAVRRTTTTGTGGTQTPAAHGAFGSYGGVCRSLPSPGGTLGDTLAPLSAYVPSAAAGFAPLVVDFSDAPVEIVSGAGLALYSPGAAGSAGISASIDFFTIT